MAIISKETSYSSVATYYTLNSFTANHENDKLTVTINLTIKGGSSSSLGKGAEKIRKVYLYDNAGAEFNGTKLIKDSNTSWGTGFNQTFNITYTKTIGYKAWKSNCYIRIGLNNKWNETPPTSSFYWNGKKSTNGGNAGQTFLIQVNKTSVKPSITIQPKDLTINVGNKAIFNIKASNGNPPIYKYQWLISKDNGGHFSNLINNASGDTYITDYTNKNYNGYLFKCNVCNEDGCVLSNPALLTVNYPMEIKSNYPLDINTNVNTNPSFKVEIATDGNPAHYTYEWFKNDVLIPEATAAECVLNAVQVEDDNSQIYCKITHTETGTTLQTRTAKLKINFSTAVGSIANEIKINEGRTEPLSVNVITGNPLATTVQFQILNGDTYENMGDAFSISHTGKYNLNLTDISYDTYNNKKVRVKLINEAGTSYSNEAVLKVNRTPSKPSLLVPNTNTITYNTMPYILFKWGIDPDGEPVTGVIEINNVKYTSTDKNTIWFNGGKKSTEAISLIKLPNLDYGDNIIVKAYCEDDFLQSTIVTRIFSIKQTNFTDVITPNITMVKLVHLTELREKINNLESYYNLDLTTWSNDLSTVKANHIIELRTAVEKIILFLNSYNAGLSTIKWTETALKGKRIKAIHMNEIRNIINKL